MTNGIFLFNIPFLDYDAKIAQHVLPVALGVEAGMCLWS